MKSLGEIEAAIAELPKESQQQLLRDMPALCPAVFPSDGWDVLSWRIPRRGLVYLPCWINWILSIVSNPTSFWWLAKTR